LPTTLCRSQPGEAAAGTCSWYVYTQGLLPLIRATHRLPPSGCRLAPRCRFLGALRGLGAGAQAEPQACAAQAGGAARRPALRGAGRVPCLHRAAGSAAGAHTRRRPRGRPRARPRPGTAATGARGCRAARPRPRACRPVRGAAANQNHALARSAPSRPCAGALPAGAGISSSAMPSGSILSAGRPVDAPLPPGLAVRAWPASRGRRARAPAAPAPARTATRAAARARGRRRRRRRRRRRPARAAAPAPPRPRAPRRLRPRRPASSGGAQSSRRRCAARRGCRGPGAAPGAMQDHG